MDNKIKIIEQFFEGNLQGDNLQWFHDQLRNQRDFIDLFILHFELNNAINEHDIIKLRKKLEKIYQAHKETHKKRIIPPTRRFLYLAASFIFMIIGVGGIFYMLTSQYTPGDLYNKFYSPYQSVVSYGTPLEDVNKSLDKAFHFYDNGQYEKALDNFEMILQKQSGNDYVGFYAAMSYLELDKEEEAQQLLNDIIKEKDGLFTELSKWYLALSYLKTENTKKAKTIFNELIYSNSNYKDKAELIVRNIG